MATKPLEPEFDYGLMDALFAKKFGKETKIVDMEAMPRQGAVGEYLPTGSFSLDMAIGVGGFKLGTINEIYGQESSGKSTLVLATMVQAQRMFPTQPVAYIDSENGLNPDYAIAMGLDLSKDRFILVQENEAERALNMAQFFAERGIPLVVTDSVAALVPKAQMESGDTVDSKMGGNAKFLSAHLPKMVGICKKSRTIAIYVNQIREKFVMFGNPETTTGGRALKFYSALRIETRVKEQIKQDGDAVGIRVTAETKKNKIGGSPFRKALYPIMFGKGIDRVADLADTAIEHGYIEKSGSWFVVGDKKVQGRDEVVNLLEANPDLQTALEDTIWSAAA